MSSHVNKIHFCPIFRFIVDIYDVEREKLLDKIKKAIYFSILIDGATDSATLENELIYVRFLATDGPVNAYLSIQDVKHGNANGILDAIHAGTIGIK